MTGVQTEFPPPPRRATVDVNGPKAGQGLPPPQPRRPDANANGHAERETEIPRLPPRPVDLLGDNDAGISGWEVLKPN